MPFPESKRAKTKRYYFDHNRVIGQPVQCRGQSLTSQAYARFTD